MSVSASFSNTLRFTRAVSIGVLKASS